MSARSHRRQEGSRAGLVAVASAALVLGTLPLLGTALPASAEPTARALADDERVTEVVVSGRVTEEGSGTPLSGLCVAPFQWFDVPECAEGELTDERGTYQRVLRVPSVAGDEGGVWVEPAAGDELHRYATAPLTLTDAGEYRVDLQLPRAGVLVGRAVDDATRKPVAGACPQVRGLDGATPDGYAQATCSDADGVWRLGRVPLTPVAVALMGTATTQASYVPKGATIAKAERYSAEPGGKVELPETRLEAGATVSVVTSRADRGTNTIILHPSGSLQDLVTEPISSSVVAADGISPVLTNVQAGQYLVEVRNTWDAADCSPETPICSSLAPWWAPGTVDPGKAKAIKIKAGESVTFEATMKKYRRIALQFRNLPKGYDVGVTAYFPSGVPWEIIGADYLPPTAMKLQLAVEERGGKRKQWWAGGGSGLSDAVLIDEGTGRLVLDSPITIAEPEPTDDPEPTKTVKTKTTKIKTTKPKATKVVGNPARTTKVKTTKTKNK